MAADLSAVERRAQDAEFIATCQWSTWRARLPLPWPTSPGTPPSPKHAYRSHYVYLGSDDLADPAVWEHLSEFDLAACRRGTHNGPSANKTRRVFADRPTQKRVKTV